MNNTQLEQINDLVLDSRGMSEEKKIELYIQLTNMILKGVKQ